ncbi:MAG: hypothetical protein O7E49_12845 [Gemmatimonadetes bacterium]|nr:hypothetical protein [Gemmatimonadota bacterium]
MIHRNNFLMLLGILVTPSLAAQQMTPEIGLIGGFGIEQPYKGALGLGGGVLLGRLYAGGRIIRHFGTSSVRTGTMETTTTDVSTWVAGAEIGIPILLEPIEVKLSALVGISRFTEDTRREPNAGGTSTETSRGKTTGMFSPVISALVPLSAIKIGAELALLNGGDPNFSETYGTRSVAFYAKIVVPLGS